MTAIGIGISPVFGSAAGAGGAAVPDAPANLTATAVSGSQVDLSWDAVAEATGYKIERGTNGIDFVQIDTVGAVTTYNDTGLGGGVYYYRIRATGAGGDSNYSNTATASTLIVSLISFWELEEASGTRVDAHGSNDLTDNNTVTQDVGVVGNAAAFVTLNQEYLSRADNADLSTGDIDFTVATWVKLGNTAHNGALMSKYTTNLNQREYMLLFSDNDPVAIKRFGFLISNDGAAVVRLAASTIGEPTAGVWYFVVAWHDAANNTINIQVNNGTVDSAAHATGVLDSTASFRMGAMFTTAALYLLQGSLDQSGFWKRILSSDEKTFLYNSGNGRAYSAIAP